MTTRNKSVVAKSFLCAAGITFLLFSCENASDDRVVEHQKVDHFVRYSPSQEEARTAFLEFLPKVSEGLELNTDSELLEEQGFTIILADLNNDSLLDAIVDYSLTPSREMNGGGGNAIGEISGLVYFKNDGSSLIFGDHTDEFQGNFGSRNELQKVENGTVFLKKFDYAEDDGRCCPSIPYLTELEIVGEKFRVKKKPYQTEE